MPGEVTDIKTFLEIARRKDAKCMYIASAYLFLGYRYLLALHLPDAASDLGALVCLLNLHLLRPHLPISFVPVSCHPFHHAYLAIHIHLYTSSPH